MENIYVAFSSEGGTVGRVADISRGGLGVEYVFDRYRAGKQCNVDIIARDWGVLVEDVPCRVTYDKIARHQTTLVGFETRRCGLQFGTLTEHQAGGMQPILAGHNL